MAGALPGIVAVLLHNAAITGHPLVPAYDHVALAKFEQQTVTFGFGWPNLEVAWALVFSPARGLLFHVPLLFAYLVAAPEARRPLAGVLRSPVLTLAAASIVAFSAFYMWEGGLCYGPRFLVPLAVLLLYRLGHRLVTGRPFHPLVLAAVGGLGVLMNLVVLNTTMYVPAGVVLPFSRFLLVMVEDGALGVHTLAARLLPASPGWRVALWVAGFALVLTFAYRSSGVRPEPKRAVQ